MTFKTLARGAKRDALILALSLSFALLLSSSAARALKQFSDGVKTVEVKAAYVDGKVLDAKAVATLASLPSKTQLQAQVLGMFASPLRGFVGLLAANPGGFVRVLNARAQQVGEPATS